MQFYNVIEVDFGAKQVLPTDPYKAVDMTPLLPSKPSAIVPSDSKQWKRK
ncbi:hypothetical protein [Sporosarcina sp. P1]|nr:hypothetical protein [Sporosarcina sp. P1]